MQNNNCRTILMSDLHLGSSKCKAEAILKVLHDNFPQKLYLVGDIIDFWALKRNFFFPDSHWRVIQKIIRMSHKGTEVYYITGNHDDILRTKLSPIRTFISPIKFYESTEWKTLNGKNYLVIHGDQFDRIITNHKWVAVLGDVGYSILLKLNKYFPFKGSLARLAKTQAKRIFLTNFERTLRYYAKDQNYMGVVCGHIHSPSINFDYINCGDFVDSCSFIKEDLNGDITLQFEKI